MFDEALVRAVARATAEEVLRLTRPDYPQGPEASPAGLPFQLRTFPAANPGTFTVGANIRSFAVLAGGHEDFTITVREKSGQTVSMPATPGLHIKDAVMELVTITVPAGDYADLLVLVSRTPGAFAVCCDEPDRFNLAQSQSVVDTAVVTQIVAPRAGRKNLLLSRITETQDVFLGDAAVTVNDGVRWDPGDVLIYQIPNFAGALWGIAATAAQTLHVLEVF